MGDGGWEGLRKETVNLNYLNSKFELLNQASGFSFFLTSDGFGIV